MIVNDSPEFLSMVDFRAAMDRYGGLAKSARFVVRIVPVGGLILKYATIMQDLTYLCEIAELPGRGLTNIDVRYYGPNQKFPFQTTYEDINLTFLCRTASKEREFFDDWVNAINPNNSFDFSYRDDYVARLHIYQMADYGFQSVFAPDATYKITLHHAYPLLVNPQPVTWQDDAFQRLQVNLTYTHWTRQTEAGPLDFSLVEGRAVNRPV